MFIATFALTIIAAINIEKVFEKIAIKEIMLFTTIILIYVSPLILANNFNSTIIDEKYEGIDELIPGTGATRSARLSRIYTNKSIIKHRIFKK